MFNFCHPSLNPLVTCSTISSEGYEITNLVSSEWSKRQRGFMVYNSIKPPVDLTFTFMCNIKLSHIIIWPQVGCQKSSGFELQTCSSSLHTLGEGHSKDNINLGSDFVRVGCGFLNDEAGIVFHVTNIPVSSYPSNFLMRSLSNKQNSLYKTDNLRIRILKTYSSSLPAIAKIEVWGCPSRSCTQDTRMRVLQLWNSGLSVISKVKKSKPKDDGHLLVPNVGVAVPMISHTEFTIPEEFLDAITCEVMVIPVTLPCGKVVDQSTLEKHQNVEANWGRTASDPFTGKVFTDVNRPIVAVSLKTRIDKFIVENIERKELQNIPRTVGRKQGATLKELSIPKKDINREGSGKRNQDFVSFDELNRKRKRSVLSGVSKQKETSVLTSVISDNEVNRSYRNVKACSVTSSTQRSYEDMLDDSLNSALKSTLSNLPTFLKFDCKKVLARVNCCTQCEGSDNLFKLPCSHLLCRSCLLQKTHAKQLNCIECNDVFRSSDPKRHHV